MTWLHANGPDLQYQNGRWLSPDCLLLWQNWNKMAVKLCHAYVASYPTSLVAFLPLPFRLLHPLTIMRTHLLWIPSLTSALHSFLRSSYVRTRPISSRLDLDKWINDPPSEGEEDNQPDGGDFSFLSAKGEFDDDLRKKKKGKKKKGAEDEDDLDQEELERVCMYVCTLSQRGKYWFHVID